MSDPLGLQFSFLSAHENGALRRAVITGQQEVWKAWPETVEEHYVDAAQRGVTNAGFTPGRLAEKAVEFIEKEAAAYREVLEKVVKLRADGLGADAADEVDAACVRRAERRREQVLAGLRDRILRNQPLRDHPVLLASCRERLEKGTARAYRHVAAQIRLEMFVRTPEKLGRGHDRIDAESLLGRIVAELKADTKSKGRLKLPAQTLTEAIENRPDKVRMHGNASGVRRRLGQLNKRYPGIKDCYVTSGNTVTFIWDRFRQRAAPWANSHGNSRA